MALFDADNYRRIPYEEYKAIGELMHAHVKTHEEQLRAMVAFGDILTRGGTYNIDLLEVVENWQGPRSVVFASSSELPLRGELRLYLLTPEEFEDGVGNAVSAERDLLNRVREGYDVIYENPAGYARRVFAQGVTQGTAVNPLEFLVSGNAGRQP
jgi:hypothetical protein